MRNDHRELQDELVTMRRQLHRIPELGLQLPQTAAYVAARLDAYGIPYRNNRGDDGIIATLEGGQPGKTVALRADMDGLPIREETGVDYASQHDGCMHACGHDCHTAMLLGAVKLLKARQKELHGSVRLLFQTAEENTKGAQVMLDNGAMDGVDAVFGMHIGCILDKTIPSGKVVAAPGAVMAAVDAFRIRVRGMGCHGSTPEKGIDPVNIAAHIIIALQTINSREWNACVPVVLVLGAIHGGTQGNIIPDEVVIEGTLRTLDRKVRQQTVRRIGEIAAGTAAVFGGSAELELCGGVPPVINDPAMAAFAAETVGAVLGEDAVIPQVAQPNMGGEDFSLYLERVPGAFLFLSSSDAALKTDIPHHNPKFNVDERVLWRGSAVLAALAEGFLNGTGR